MHYSSVWVSCNDEAFGTSLPSRGPRGGLEVMYLKFGDAGLAPQDRNSCAESEVHSCAEAGLHPTL
jgi:hypothetical protein